MPQVNVQTPDGHNRNNRKGFNDYPNPEKSQKNPNVGWNDYQTTGSEMNDYENRKEELHYENHAKDYEKNSDYDYKVVRCLLLYFMYSTV